MTDVEYVRFTGKGVRTHIVDPNAAEQPAAYCGLWIWPSDTRSATPTGLICQNCQRSRKKATGDGPVTVTRPGRTYTDPDGARSLVLSEDESIDAVVIDPETDR